MSSTTLSAPATNIERLTAAGITLDHLEPEMRNRLNELAIEEVETLIDIKRRFAGDLPIDPTMFEGSAEF